MKFPARLQGYQFNHLVQRTDELYPALWVAPGSAASPLGAAMGMDADFVTGGLLLLQCFACDSQCVAMQWPTHWVALRGHAVQQRTASIARGM